MKRCTFPGVKGDEGPCGRVMVGDRVCPVHDRAKCSCGTRLLGGTETHCPKCGKDNRLQTVLKGGA